MLDSESGSTATGVEASPRPWAGIVTAVRGMEYGATIATATLYAASGILETPARAPGERDASYARKCRRQALRFASLMSEARRELLEVHRRDLRSERPGEYRLVLPGAQADQAQRDALREARRALSVGSARAEHVEVRLMSDAECKRASDVEAHLDALRGMLRAKR